MRGPTQYTPEPFDIPLLELALQAVCDQPIAVQRAAMRQIEDHTLRLTIEGKDDLAETLHEIVSSLMPGSFAQAGNTRSRQGRAAPPN